MHLWPLLLPLQLINKDLSPPPYSHSLQVKRSLLQKITGMRKLTQIIMFS